MELIKPILQFISYAFIASVIVFVVKIIFFRKSGDAYIVLLKFCMAGIIIGLIASYAFCYGADKYCLTGTDLLDTIPFWTMITGLLVGLWFLTGPDKPARVKDEEE